MQQQVIAQVQACLLIAANQLNKNFAMPTITFNQRGKIAATARLQTNEIRFNPVLLADNLSEFLAEVVPHEVCHLLAYQLYGRVKPHGKEWQQLMRQVFNTQPHTYHKMNVAKVAGKTFNYRCECGPVALSIRRHNKVKKGKQQYICRKCQTILSPQLHAAAN